MSESSSVNDQRALLRKKLYADEDTCVETLLADSNLDPDIRRQALNTGRELVYKCREQSDHQETLDAFLQEFGLSNREGVALMCLAESLLRVTDADTADELIAEKLTAGEWVKHLGHSESLFVNASTWGLMLSGTVITLDRETREQPASWIKKLVHRAGEPVIRRAVLHAMRIMGGQYILGRNIEEARKRGPKINRKGTRFSFDMLGEGARTKVQVHRYREAYLHAIQSIGKANDSEPVEETNGISIKLSALHPRYEINQRPRVMAELLPVLLELAQQARQFNIGLAIDAEEVERLDISLDLFEALAREPSLQNWDGLGLVVQAYQKRAPYVIDWLTTLARETGRRFMVRLVKGAYWDREIKRAQELGVEDYPVFTRKANTDLSYYCCAGKLLSASDVIYPQFATHNAYTIGQILALAKDQPFELQRLHGMGHLLYEQLAKIHPDIPVRVYAPVGAHKDLLPYLVRRLLENGANSSFVNRFMSRETPVEKLIEDLHDRIGELDSYRHPALGKPVALFEAADPPRKNSPGMDLTDPVSATQILEQLRQKKIENYSLGPVVNGELIAGEIPVVSSADCGLKVGASYDATIEQIEKAIDIANQAQPEWNAVGGENRASIIENIATTLERETPTLLYLISHEAGRTLPDAVSEIREAIDFCYYYAAIARRQFGKPRILMGPTGEHNELSLCGRGVFACISPWNFPLAIFTGQIVAALAAGNSVVAKPAEQTPLIASYVTRLMHRAGIPKNILHLVTGDGATVGKILLSDSRLAGVAFTGSTETAKIIDRQLSQREGPIIPFIAETGGINAMIVDSTALPEQVVDDVITSAFKSAGQRCSALRVLYLQEENADQIMDLLKGACDELTVGFPWQLECDIGPVIDREALQNLRGHIEQLDRQGKLIYRYQKNIPENGIFIGPHIAELKNISELSGEVFGPVLHVIRFSSKSLPQIIRDIDNTGYGLTLGIHSRIEKRAEEIFRQTRVGNTYVNRNMIGAVVGVNPFGGVGLSGTGPKAGGPHYLLRFATERTRTVNTTATGGNTELFQNIQ